MGPLGFAGGGEEGGQSERDAHTSSSLEVRLLGGSGAERALDWGWDGIVGRGRCAWEPMGSLGAVCEGMKEVNRTSRTLMCMT